MSITITPDTLVEGDETIGLQLSNPTGSGLSLGGTTTHVATITDDESADVEFVLGSSSTAENGGTHNIVLQLNLTAGTLGSDVIVDITDLLSGTALSATDYAALGIPAQLTFTAGSADGATIVLPLSVIDDLLSEGDETLDLQITGIAGPATVGGTSNHTVTIVDEETPTVAFQSGSSTAAGESGTHNIIVVLTTNNATPGVITVDITDLLTGNASSGTDYIALASPVTITFPANSVNGATQVIPISILTDLLLEGDEILNLQLSNVTGLAAIGATTNHAATIPDDESGSVTFAAGASSVAESATTHQVIVTLNLSGGGTLADDETVDITDLLSGTANSATDYNALAAPVSVTFPAGAADGATQVVNVSILDDLLAEGDETVNLQLSNPSSPLALGANTNHAITITDPEAPSVIFSPATSASPGESGTIEVVVKLVVPGGGSLADQATVEISDTGGGSASSGTDYGALASPVTVTFPASSADCATQVVSITITPDTIIEGDETIDLQLANPSGSGLTLGSTTTHIATITDDETASVAFAAAGSSVAETVGTHSVIIRLSATGGSTLSGPVVVDITDLLSGSATSATDYNALAAPIQLTFPAGAADGATLVIPITILDDLLTEGSETIALRLTALTGPATLGSPSNHSITIVDDETPTISFQSGSSTSATESGTHNVVIVLSTASALPGDITFDVTDLLSGSANSAIDYTALAAPLTLTFTAGSTDGATVVVPISILTDLLLEGSETIDLQLSNVSGIGALGSTTAHTASVTDDESGSVQFQSGNSSETEANTTHNVIVTLSLAGGATLANAETIDISDLLSGTANSATDYTALGIPVTVTFPAGAADGATVLVPIQLLDDSLLENDETLNLQLSNPSSPLTLGSTTAHTATIIDNEVATVQYAVATSSAAENGGTHNVVVQLAVSGGGSLAIDVTVDARDLLSGSATTSTDYGAFGTVTLTFAAGSINSATQHVPITIINDSISEGNETIDLILENPSAELSLAAQTTHVATIVDDEIATVEFAAGTSSLFEEGVTHEVVVQLNVAGGGTLGSTVTVDVTDLLTGTAGSTTDYNALAAPIQLTFPAGTADGATQVISITIIEDALREADETINLQLSNPTGNLTLGGSSNHSTTILDDEGDVHFQLATSSVGEGDGTHNVIIVLDLANGPIPADVVVEITDLLTGSATSASDYNALAAPVSVTFTAGSANGATVVVPITTIDDGDTELNETIALQITSVTGNAAAAAPSNHTVTINDNDLPERIQFQTGSSSIIESGGTHFVLVELIFLAGGAPLVGDVTVDIRDALTGTATGSGTDYSFIPNPITVTFTAGSAAGTTRQVAIPITSDLIVEGDETINLVLENIVGPAGLPSDVTVDVTDLGTGTALSGTDYNALAAPVILTFPAGATSGATQVVNINVVSDTLGEGDETIDLRLANPSSPAALGSTTNHSVTITDGEAPSVIFAPGTSASPGESGTIEVVVKLVVPGGGTLGSQATVDIFDTGGGSATSGSDYSALASPVTVTFPAGSADCATQVISITITPDTLIEGDETIDLQLSNPGGSGLTLGSTTTHIATITDDETADVAFAASTSSAAEDGGTHDIVIQLTTTGGGTLGEPVVVDITDLLSGSSTSATDYAALGIPVQITFPAGAANGTTLLLPVSILNDLLIEGDETLDLQLTGISGPATIGGTSNHTATITDDDTPTVALQSATSSVVEANTTHNVIVVLSISGGGTLGSDLTVDVTDLLSGSANSATDYNALASPITITFPSGAGDGATLVVPITIVDDLFAESNETIALRLSNPSGPGILGSSTNHTATILDDDSPSITFTPATSTIAESGGTLEVVVKLNVPGGGSLTSQATVDITDTGGDTAIAGADYTAIANPLTITFNIGANDCDTQVVSIPITDDNNLEDSETINLELSNPTGSNLGGTDTHVVTITDNDTATVRFEPITSSTPEGAGSIQVLVKLDIPGGVLETDFTVDVTDAGTGSASSGTDYPVPGTITVSFSAIAFNCDTQVVSIPITDDTLTEGNETLNLLLSNPSDPAVSLGAATNHVATITDDDTATVDFQVSSSTTGLEDVAGTHTVVIDLSVIGGGTIGEEVVVSIADLFTGTATSAADYTALSIPLQVTFTAGSVDGATQVINIPITPDVLVEGSENLNLNIFNISGPASIGSTDDHVVLIPDDDGPYVAFENVSSSIAEDGSGTVELVVKLSIPTGPAVTLTDFTIRVVDTFSGNATFGADYTAGFLTTLTFPAGSADCATQVVSIAITDDNIGESDETINYRLFSQSGDGGIGVVTGVPTLHQVTITDDEVTTVTFQTDTSSADENGGSHEVILVLDVDSGGTAEDAITVFVVDELSGTALSGTDYSVLALPIVVTFPAGSASGSTQVVTIPVLADALTEGPETIDLDIFSVSGSGSSIGATSFHVVVITDDSATVGFQASTSSAPEAVGNHEIVVVLSIAGGGTLADPVTLLVNDLGTGTATSSTDYTPFSPFPISFPAGSADGATAIVTIPITQDLEIEGSENINLDMTSITGPATPAGTLHTVTIVDDEVILVQFVDSVSSVLESNTTHQVIVELSSASALLTELTVDVTNLLTGTASSGTDYSVLAAPITLTFPIGAVNGDTQVINIPIISDANPEADETIDLRLSNPSAPVVLGATTNHVVTITDNDTPIVSFATATSSVVEANTTEFVVVTLTIGGGGVLGEAVTVDINDVGSGSASSDTDHTALASPVTVTFPLGSANGATQLVPVSVLQDFFLEGDETVDLQLSNPLGGGSILGAITEHNVTITDDETGSVQFANSASNAAENGGTHQVVVVLTTTGALGSDMTVSVTDLLTGTASSGTDYSVLASPIQLTFPAGSPNGSTQVVSIPVIDDSLAENAETIDLRLSNPTSPLTLGSTTNHVVTITDDDTATVQFTPGTSTVGEANTNPADDFITVTLQGVVANSAINNDGDTKTNTFSITDGVIVASDTADVSVVEGNITVTKSVDNVTRCNSPATIPYPGDVLEYTLSIQETQGLDVHDLNISDVLSEYMLYDTSFTPTASGAGNTIGAATVSGSGGAGDPQTLTWSLALGNADIDISANATITIVYRVAVSASVPGGATVDNTATVGFTSLDGVDVNERTSAFAPGVDDYIDLDTVNLATRPSPTQFIIPASRRRNPTFIDANGIITGPGSPGTLSADDELILTNGSGVTFTGDGVSGPPPAGAPDITVNAGASTIINTDGTNTFQYGIVTINAGGSLVLTGDSTFTMEQIVMGAGSTLTLAAGTNLTVTGPCEFNGGIGTANYAVVQASGGGNYNITFNCSFLGDHFRFEDIGSGKLTFNGDTQMDFGIFQDGTGVNH